MRSMPVDDAVKLAEFDGDQAAAAWPAHAFAREGAIHRTMSGADDELAAVVKKTIGLEIEFHGDVAAAIEVSPRLALETDGECSACLPRIDHVKGHAQALFLQIAAVAQRDERFRHIESAIESTLAPSGPHGAVAMHGNQQGNVRHN